MALNRLVEAAPYHLPERLEIDARYDAAAPIAALGELTRLFDDAEFVLQDVAAAASGLRPGPSEVRVWPHHLDMATLITLEEGPAETARAVGVGLARPDDVFDEFYWYAYASPHPAGARLPKLKSRGRYSDKGFVGAVLPMSEVVKRRDQEATVRAFLEESVGVLRAALGG